MFSSNTSQVSNDVNYIEDVFSNFLYTGNGSTQTITNGIDLAGKGGLVWIKQRSSSGVHCLVDTARGANIVFNELATNNTNAQNTGASFGVTSLNSTGFSLSGGRADNNGSGSIYASWTFRKQPKFYTQGTYTGTGVARTIAHDLGAVPGCIIVKRTDAGGDNWLVYHRSLGATKGMKLNLTDAQDTVSVYWNNTEPTATEFTVGSGGDVNASGGTYVYYAFAHNAGGFGLTGTDNVISCGSFTTDGSENSTTDLGYEPQWLLLKATAGGTAGSQPWHIFDGMRGLTVAGRDDASLQPNNSNAESQVNRIGITSTGFTTSAFGANTSFIYIAIRRGPMKTPTSGTEVFQPRADASAPGITTDFVININRAGGVSWSPSIGDRLRGSPELTSSSTAAEAAAGYAWASMTGLSSTVTTGRAYEYFRRAPGFFDEVCYTGDGVSERSIAHNLTVAPELIITKDRSRAGTSWTVWNKGLPSGYVLILQSDNPQDNGWGTNYIGTPGAISYLVGATERVNQSGDTYVAYLFASCPGVSKCGSYTGTGTTQQINCGFTAGARFVLIKRTDSTGDWYVWDSARGIVAGNDPYLLLNSTAAEVTTTDYVDTFSSGFEISSTAPAAINASGGTFIYLAIA